jgi:hypothetical protein
MVWAFQGSMKSGDSRPLRLVRCFLEKSAVCHCLKALLAAKLRVISMLKLPRVALEHGNGLHRVQHGVKCLAHGLFQG